MPINDEQAAANGGGIVNCAAYRAGRRVRSLSIDEIPAALAEPGTFVWLGLFEPGEELLERVQAAFGLHELAIEDAHRAHQRPKLERYGDSLFMVLRTARFAGEPRRLEFGETHLFVGARYVVSVRHGSHKSHVELRARCEEEAERLALGPSYVLYALMDFLVDQYFPVIEELEEEFEEIEGDVFDGHARRETTQNIYELRRDLLHLRRAIFPLIDVCLRLERWEGALVPEEIRVYFRDVYDHLLRIHEMLDALREMAGSALEAHLSLLSVTQSDDMKRLAAWAAIIAVPTMVAGVYGMNFEHMPELSWPWGYPLVVAATAALCLGLYRRFKKINWL